MKSDAKGTGLFRNTVSYLGMLIVFIGALLTLLSLILEWSIKRPSPYLGIFSFLLFPAIIVFGVLVMLFGGWREVRRRGRLGAEAPPPYPRVDLNDVRHRKVFSFVVVGGFLLLVLMGFAGYNAFLFTESNVFCGKLCHVVMEPEYTAYQYSSHAKVPCVECHVGSGASFYVKSKLSGVRQVFAVAFDAYEKPIPTPIEHLRPARETCEECHWPNKFYGAQLVQIPYFRFDEQNTSDQISLLIKTGGGSARLGQSAGIHWHMIIENTVIYAARDAKRQDIPWFKVTGPSGEERAYMSTENPSSPEELAKLPRRVMDCMDCHNRPSHGFLPPDQAVDKALGNGVIDSTIPWIKKVVVEALTASYPDNKAAEKEICNRIFNYYATNHPKIYAERYNDIRQAVTMAVGIYNRSVFPGMNIDWRTYPENIGHRNWPGCFRCHDGKHVTKTGKALSNECTICHTMPQRGPTESLGALPPITDISWHPFSLKGRHGELPCTKCHTAGVRPRSECGACHKYPTSGPMSDMDCDACHTDAPAKLPLSDCADCHDDLPELHLIAEHKQASCMECHKPHEWSVSERESCLTCHENRDRHEDKQGACVDCHKFAP